MNEDEIKKLKEEIHALLEKLEKRVGLCEKVIGQTITQFENHTHDKKGVAVVPVSKL